MRTVFIALIAGLVALAIGFGVAAQVYGARLAEADKARMQAEFNANRAAKEAQDALPELEAVRAQIARLEADYASCMNRTQELNQQMSALEPAQTAPIEEESDKLDAMLDAAPAPEDELPTGANPPAADTDERDQRQDRGWDSPERIARMEEFRQQADDFFAQEIANAPDPDTATRIQSIDELRKEMFELRTQLREAKNEEERAALEAQSDAVRQELQQALRDHQRYMLGTVGRNYGLRGEDLRNFQQELRNTLESPFFTFGGAGGRGGGRGLSFRP